MAERLYRSRKVTIGTESMSITPVGRISFPFIIQPPIRDADPTIINNDAYDSSGTKIHITGHDDDATYGWVQSDELPWQVGRNHNNSTPEEVHQNVTRRFELLCDPLGIAATQVVFLPEQRGNGAEM